MRKLWRLLKLAVVLQSMALSAIVGLGSRAAWAEGIPPGTYRGTYHRDRWSQPRFDFLFVDPALERTFRPHVGVPLEIDATGVDQPVNPGGAMITAVGDIRKLPQPLEISVGWADVPQGANGRDELRQVQEGGAAKIRVTVANRGDRPCALNDESIQTWMLVLAIRRPSRPGLSDYFDFWSNWEGYAGRFGFGERQFTICRRKAPLSLKDGTYDAKALPRVYLPAPRPDTAPLLNGGESHAWTITIENLPPNEYEVSVEYLLYQKSEQAYITVESNKLRLDALTPDPLSWGGLAIRLNQPENAKIETGESIPLEVHFTNRHDKPLHFGLPKTGGQIDLSRYLACYDRTGVLLPLPVREHREVEFIRLTPGQSSMIRSEAPAASALARVAFYHSYFPKGVPPEETRLENGYAFSPHLRLTARP